MVSNKSYAW